MECDEPGTVINSLEPSSEETSQDSICDAKAKIDFNPSSLSVDDDRLASAEALLDNLIQSVCDVDSDSSQHKDTKECNIDNNSDAKCDTKETITSAVNSHVPKLPFQLSDNMKKGLSMLAFPSKKTHSRKKGITTSRTTSNSRITIGEALEKAQDARKCMVSVFKKADGTDTDEGGTVSDTKVQHLSSGSSVVVSAKQVGNSKMDTTKEGEHPGKSDVDTRETVGEKENWTNTATVPAQSVPPSLFKSSCNNQHAKVAATSKEGKRLPLAGKIKPPANKLKLSSRMWELLRFTFRHEHFPTSVHMARLAKMMGVQWSQIRNWFTERRVENKRAGIFPRDKLLDHCPYCDVSLKTEAEQKGHLFSTHHVKNILGQEYIGGNSSEPIKWKKIPNSINAVNKSSGARVLAVGFPDAVEDETLPASENSQTHPPVRLTDELSGKNKVKSKKLQKRWADSMQLQSERGKGSQWSASSTSRKKKFVEQPVDNGKLQEINESVLLIKMEDGEERIVKSVDHGNDSEKLMNTKKLLLSNRITHIPSSASNSISILTHGYSDSNNSKHPQELTKVSIVANERIMKKNKTVNKVSVKKRSLSQEDKTVELKYARVDDKLAGIPNFPVEPLIEPKIENVCGAEEVKMNQSHQSPYEIKPVQEQVRKFKIGVQMTENPITSFSESSQGAKCQTPRPKLGIIASEESCSSSKRASYLRTSHTGSFKFKSHKNMRNALDEAVIIGYRCPTCSKIFLTEWLMIKHSITHFRYQCDICEQVYPSESMLKHHIHDHLTGAYEDEKYYCQLSCKVCHSLKCECFEPTFCKTKEIPKAYTRPQKARRTKKTFISKPNSSPNDHLLVTLADYKRLFQNSAGLGNVRSGRPGPPHVSQKSDRVSGNSKCNTPQKLQPQGSEHEADVKYLKNEESKECDSQERGLCLDKTKQTATSLVNLKDTAEVITQNNLIDVKIESVSSPQSEDQCSVEEEPIGIDKRKRPYSRRRSSKLSSNFVYRDTDFYYMCEMCDASFLSKAELGEHMFFHRLKSRSRRGEKRGPPGTAEEEREEVLKRLKVEELQNNEEVETINVGGFERFKCPLCKGHFASVTDLNRHRTQAHKGCETDISLDLNVPVQCTEVFQCTYCEKFYRRERELRRHLKHDCSSAPKYLKDKLSMGVTLTYLQNLGDGPHYRMVKRNPEENSLHDPALSKTHTKATPRGPITCKYCSMVTRREAEMKRHVWKYCPKIPKDVVKRFKEGTTLEELGFLYANEKTEPAENSDSVSNPLPDESGSTPTLLPVPQVPTTQSSTSQTTLPVPNPVLPYLVPLPMVSSSKSKEPLVCSYCGIWYFREMAILKHMRERCIKLPAYEKELLKNGARICNVPRKTDESGNSSKFCRATYKMVKVPEHLASSLQVPIQVNQDSVSKEETVNIEVSDEVMRVESPAAIDKIQALPVNRKPTVGRGRSGGPNKKGTRCRRCHENYKSFEAVLAHSSVHHGPKKGLYKCKLCQVRMPKYKQLREHVWEHTDETPYRCHVCEVKYRSSDALVEHLRVQHEYRLINERNLYKWLPGRNGKYRDIKPIVKDNCEETFDDLDANLDNLAEVMVITDRDIWTGRNEVKTSVDREHFGARKITDVAQQEMTSSSQTIKPANTKLQSVDSSSKNPQSINLLPENNTVTDEGLECKISSPIEHKTVRQLTIETNCSVQKKENNENTEKQNPTSWTDSKEVVDNKHIEKKTLKVDDSVKLKEVRKKKVKLEHSSVKTEGQAIIMDSKSVKSEEEDSDLIVESENTEGNSIKVKTEGHKVRGEILKTGASATNRGEVTTKKCNKGEVTTKKDNKGEVTTKKCNKGEVTTKKYNKGEVTTKKDNKGEVTTKKCNKGEVTTKKYNKGEVTTKKDNKGEVTTNKCNKGEVTTKKYNKGEVMTKKDNKGEVTTKKYNKGEVTTKKDNKGEVTTKKDNKGEVTTKKNNKEVTTKKDNKREVTTKKDNQREVTTKKDNQGEVTTKKDNKEVTTKKDNKEVTTKKDNQGEVTTKKDNKREVTTKKDIQGEVTTKKDNKGEVTTKKDNKGEVTTKKDNQGEVTTKKDNQGEVTTKKDNQGEVTTKKDNQGEVTTKKDNQGEVLTKKDNQGEVTAKEDNQVKVTAKEDNQVEITAKEDNQVEITAKEDNQVEATAKEDNQVEATAKEDNQVEITAKEDNQVEITAKEDNQIEITAKEDNQVEVTAKEDNQVEVTAKEDNQIEVTAKEDNQVEITAKEDNQVEVTAKEDNQIEVTAKEDNQIEVTVKEDNQVEITAKEDNQVEVTAKEDNQIEVTAKEDNQVEVMAKEDNQVEATAKEDNQVEITAKEDNQVEITAKEDNQVEATAKEDNQVEIMAKEDNQIEVTAKEDNQGEVTAKEDNQVEATTKEDNQVEITAKEDNQVEITAKEDNQVEAMAKEDNQGEITVKEDNQEKVSSKVDSQSEVLTAKQNNQEGETIEEDNQGEVTAKEDNHGEITEKGDNQGSATAEWGIEGKVIAKEGELTSKGEVTDTPEELGNLKSIVIEDEDSFEDSSTENGEGLLSNLDNLESVIETIQLTDTHFS